MLFHWRNKPKWIDEKEAEKNCTVLNCIENLLISTSAVTECIFIYTFASLFGFPMVLTSSALGLKNYAITAGIESISQ